MFITLSNMMLLRPSKWPLLYRKEGQLQQNLCVTRSSKKPCG